MYDEEDTNMQANLGATLLRLVVLSLAVMIALAACGPTPTPTPPPTATPVPPTVTYTPVPRTSMPPTVTAVRLTATLVSRTQVPASPTVPLQWQTATPAWRPGAPISVDNAARVGELARWGKDTIRGLVWSRDGTQLTVASSLGIHLWNPQTLQEVRFQAIRFMETVAWKVSFSPDGRILASGSSDKTVRLWETASGREMHTIGGHTDTVSSLAFSPDGKLLMSAAQDGTVRLWGVR